MYNTKYICTYNDSGVFYDTDCISDNEKEFVLDALYRKDLLSIFGVDEFNEAIFYEILNELYKKISNNEFFVKIMETMAKQYMSTDPEFGLMLMYSYDYLHLTHPCICEFLDTGKISTDKMDKMKIGLIT